MRVPALVVVVSLVVSLASAVGCDGGGPACTDLFAFGLNVTVTDAATGARICDAVVTATDGDYTETLEVTDGAECTYIGAGERAGTYTIEVAKDGYATLTREDVVVGADECHVIGESLTLGLAQLEG